MPTRDMKDGVHHRGLTLMGKEAVGFKDVVVKGGDTEDQENGFLVKKIDSSCINKICCLEDEPPSSSASSSSIGKNSDLSGSNNSSLEKESGDGEDEEVQSSYKGGPLDAMDALEQVLPMRRGISRFYNGKSKSFASLADAGTAPSSVQDLAKPENAYMRKRRNLLACNLACNGGGISKRVTTSSSRAALALAVALNNSESDKQQARSCNSPVSSSFHPWRSFSLVDLQQYVSVATKKNCSDLSPPAKRPS